MKQENCPCRGHNLEKFIQPALLALLAREELHGYSLLQKLEQTQMLRGRRPDPSGVYRFLKLLEQRGLVQSAWDVPQAGPAKRRYRITAAGRACLRSWLDVLGDYHQSLGLFLAFASQAAQDQTQGAGAPCLCKEG